MEFRIYDRQTLAYKDGGYVASYTIDDDYIVNNNSTITIVKPLNDKVVEGDTIVLIKTSGAFHKGTINTFDNSNLNITYRSDKELFNNNILNPLRESFIEQEDIQYSSFGLDFIANILTSYFGNANDTYRQLPLKVFIDGEKEMIWTWENDQINIVDLLVDIFEKYNIALRWTIDFDITKNLKDRHPYYIVTLSVLSNSPKIIKDNINEVMQMITYTERQQPEATVCTLIDKDTKEIIQLSSGKNLINPNLSETNKYLSFDKDYGFEEKTTDENSNISGYIKVTEETYTLSCNDYDNKPRYILGYDKSKTNIVKYWTYNLTNENSIRPYIFTGVASDNVAYIKVCYYNKVTQIQLEKGNAQTSYDEYNQPAIYYLCEKDGNYYVTLNQDESEIELIDGTYYKKTLRVLPSKMKIVAYDTNGEMLEGEKKCAEDTLIPSKFNQAIEVQLNSESKMFDFSSSFGDYYKIINKNGTIDSVYTGRKENSEDKWVTLYFGLGRQNYTDLIQIKLRKNKYKIVYNQGEPL